LGDRLLLIMRGCMLVLAIRRVVASGSKLVRRRVELEISGSRVDINDVVDSY
jgi:hypothetical protein